MRHILLIIAFSIAPTALADCECLWQGSFADVQHTTDLVISGTVVASKGNSIDVSVERFLRGTDTRDAIRVWLKAKDYCRPPANNFPLGTRWVLALNRIDEEVEGGFSPHTPNVSYGRLHDYWLSSCGGYWLRQIEDRVTGNLIDAPRWEHDPKMTPVLVDLIAAFSNDQIDRDKLREASKEDPALRELILDTRAFLRNEN